ncbi:MAG: universal stress protein [Burkholderiales bacterium]|nr:universal stress protein [Bacteroidia bacterium]
MIKITYYIKVVDDIYINQPNQKMKTILIATDFSDGATHAANYGYLLAQQIKANVVLCNAVSVTAELPQAGLSVWPKDSYESLLQASIDDTDQLKSDLEIFSVISDFRPLISCINQEGTIQTVVETLITTQTIDLIIMGTHGSRGLNSFMLGNHTRGMIDEAQQPILFIPPAAKIKKVKKIAFAADFKYPKKDLVSFYSVLALARLLDAEVVLTHIYNEKHNSPEFNDWAKQSLIELRESSDYEAITYKFLQNEETDSGLNLLCEQENIGLLAMVHRQHNFFDALINGSKTQQMAEDISIPLLVLPVNN